MPVGGEQDLSVQLNVGGASTPREQLSALIEGVYPLAHWVVHWEPLLMSDPSLHA